MAQPSCCDVIAGARYHHSNRNNNPTPSRKGRGFQNLRRPGKRAVMTDLSLPSGASLPAESGLLMTLGARSIVLVGMMGAGKSSVGRRLASRLGLPFTDADNEIEAAAGMSIPEIFDAHGEADFRSGEQRVLARLLHNGPQVLATGGGAFMSASTRAEIRAHGISIWLKAEFEVLMRRIKRRTDRPMLRTDDPAATLRRLIDERYPVYAEADLTIESREVPHGTVVDEIVAALGRHLSVDVRRTTDLRGA
jgi:shikimate kinase